MSPILCVQIPWFLKAAEIKYLFNIVINFEWICIFGEAVQVIIIQFIMYHFFHCRCFINSHVVSYLLFIFTRTDLSSFNNVLSLSKCCHSSKYFCLDLKNHTCTFFSNKKFRHYLMAELVQWFNGVRSDVSTTISSFALWSKDGCHQSSHRICLQGRKKGKVMPLVYSLRNRHETIFWRIYNLKTESIVTYIQNNILSFKLVIWKAIK